MNVKYENNEKMKNEFDFKYLISYVLKYIDLKLEAHKLKALMILANIKSKGWTMEFTTRCLISFPFL